MRKPLPSSRDSFRQENLARRLRALLGRLEAVADRRAPLPAAVAGAARRTLQEAAVVVGTCFEPPAGSRSPGDIFVATLASLAALQRLDSAQEKALRRRRDKVMPARFRRR